MHARMLSMRPGATHGRENVFLVREGSPLRLALASESLAQLSSVLVPLAAKILLAKILRLFFLPSYLFHMNHIFLFCG